MSVQESVLYDHLGVIQAKVRAVPIMGVTGYDVKTDTMDKQYDKSAEEYDPLIADTTSLRYRRYWRRFSDHATELGHDPLDPPLEVLIDYLDAFGKSGMIVFVAAAIKHAFKLNNVECPLNLIDGKRELKRIVRQYGKPKKQKRGLTERMIHEIENTIYNRRPWRKTLESEERARLRGNRDLAFIYLLFFGGLRRSEALALRWCDVTKDPHTGHGILRINRSKTDRDGVGDEVFIPDRILEHLLVLQRDRDENSDSRNKIVGVETTTARKIVDRAVEAAGYNPDDFGTHSGRIGMAQHATKKGASIQQLMLLGRWKTAEMAAHYAKGIERGQLVDLFVEEEVA